LLDEAGNPVLDDWGEPIIIQARPPGYREPPPYVEFEEYCYNCGTYTPGEALSIGLISELPRRVHWPEAITVMGLITLFNFLFVVVLYKELKLVTFDAGLAAALGFRPGRLHYVLMALVSITAVGAFDAVGSILVVAFFIIPPAAAYLLTERLSIMLVLSAIIGGVGTYAGYYLSRGEFLGLMNFDWNTSISAAMVLMLFLFLLLAWVLSPRYGLVSSFVRRSMQKRFFAAQMLLGHIYHHQNSAEAAEELVPASINEHLNWTKKRTQQVIKRAQSLRLVNIEEGLLHLTGRGEKQVKRFMAENLGMPQAE
jgi:manganese/zinc/iron transport system permease protein